MSSFRKYALLVRSFNNMWIAASKLTDPTNQMRLSVFLRKTGFQNDCNDGVHHGGALVAPEERDQVILIEMGGDPNFYL